MKRVLIRVAIVLAALLILVVGLLGFVPVSFDSKEELFVIPKGTWARRRAGDPVEILPQTIYLVVDTRNVLHLQNDDDVPQIFGPTLIMPGQSFRLPFDVASEYQFACTAHVDGTMTVDVAEPLDNPIARLKWRFGAVARSFAQP